MNAMTPIACDSHQRRAQTKSTATAINSGPGGSTALPQLLTHLEDEQEPPGRTTTLLRFSPLHLPLDRLGVRDPARSAARSHGLLLGIVPELGPQRERSGVDGNDAAVRSAPPPSLYDHASSTRVGRC